MADDGRVDVHQHLVPPFYRSLLDALGLDAGGWPLPAWDPEAALAMMDRQAIAMGVLSLSAPGAHVQDDEHGRRLARQVNEYGAELVKDRPDRFGSFASLPLPDVDGALAELAYADDVLGADGVVLLSNAGGVYLGDPAYEPLWAELDARGMVVFVHPTEPPLATLPGLPGPVIDYPFDTVRTAMSLVVNGVLSRYQKVRVILSHAGGFLPYVASRMSGAAAFTAGLTPEAIQADLQRFHLDTALSASCYALPSLTAFAAPGHVLYGSDFPFAPEHTAAAGNHMLETWKGFDEADRRAVDRGNAEALFVRLAPRGEPGPQRPR